MTGLIILDLIAIVITLILPLAVMIYYLLKTERGWLYLIYGIVMYLIFQLILKIALLVGLSWIFQADEIVLGYESAIVTTLLNTFGISLVFLAFFKPKLTVAKALGISLGYGFFEPMLLYGSNSLLSLVLNMPLTSSAYIGASVEGLYSMISGFCLSAILCASVQNTLKKDWAAAVVLAFGIALLNTWLFSQLNISAVLGYVLLAVEAGLWIFFFRRKSVLSFYEPYLSKKGLG